MSHPDAGRRVGDVVLDVRDISLAFGGVKALTDISFDVREHEIRAIIGPNGAGKSSMLNCINGVYQPQQGSIALRGRTFARMNSRQVAEMGVARTFQNLALFPGLSVLENIKLGAHAQLRANFGTAALYLGPAKREEDDLTRRIDDGLLDALDLRAIRDQPVSGLPYGVQKRIELARSMVTRPRLLLLDEPAAGMNAAEKKAMSGYIRLCMTQWGATVLTIDHDMEMIMGLSDHVVVLNFGRVIATGTPAAVQRNPAVIDAYLGAA